MTNDAEGGDSGPEHVSIEGVGEPNLEAVTVSHPDEEALALQTLRQGWLTKLLSALRREWPLLVNLATCRSAWSRPS